MSFTGTLDEEVVTFSKGTIVKSKEGTTPVSRGYALSISRRAGEPPVA